MNGKIQDIVDMGPPTEPSEENPGPFFKAIVELGEEFPKEEGRDPTPLELVAMLARLLDCRDYAVELHAWENAQRLAERLKSERGRGR